jgi:hypothetical protein
MERSLPKTDRGLSPVGDCVEKRAVIDGPPASALCCTMGFLPIIIDFLTFPQGQDNGTSKRGLQLTDNCWNSAQGPLPAGDIWMRDPNVAAAYVREVSDSALSDCSAHNANRSLRPDEDLPERSRCMIRLSNVVLSSSIALTSSQSVSISKGKCLHFFPKEPKREYFS